MKQLFLSCSLLFVVLLSKAQITKGTVLLGGDLSAYKTTTNPNGTDQKVSGISVDPSIGLAVAKNLVLGVGLGLGYSSSNVNNNVQENDYSIGFFLRKYKYLGAGFYFFTGPELEWTYSDQTQNQTGGYRQDERISNINLGLETGVAYALNHHWQLEVEFPNVLEADYEHQNYTYNIPTQGGTTQYETHQAYNSYNFATSLSTDFQLVIGLRYLIGS